MPKRQSVQSAWDTGLVADVSVDGHVSSLSGMFCSLRNFPFYLLSNRPSRVGKPTGAKQPSASVHQSQHELSSERHVSARTQQMERVAAGTDLLSIVHRVPCDFFCVKLFFIKKGVLSTETLINAQQC